MKILNVVGARPNFMKIAPLVHEMEKYSDIKSVLVHTEQHYDVKMSKLFFEDLGLPKPDIALGIGSGSHAEQTARIMIEFEKVLLDQKPDLVLVVGDVNSTIACALTSAKLRIPVAHVEAGLRSYDRSMPEEINRVLTDAISDFLFITEQDARINLLREGISEDKIFFVGNVMIDSLVKNIDKAKQSKILDSMKLFPQKYAVLTLHRPSNVDDNVILKELIAIQNEISFKTQVVWPMHPRTKKRLEEFGLLKLINRQSSEGFHNIIITEPLGYLDFLQLMANAQFVMTDSGGIQEETTILNIPCLTLRENTERPVTVSQGTNIITGLRRDKIIEQYNIILSGNFKRNTTPELWDGCASERIVKILMRKNKLV